MSTSTSHKGRTLVLCFDGASVTENTNVIQLFSLLDKHQTEKQLVYYQPERLPGFTLAWGLKAHVLGGYQFLQQAYVSGDRICLFGFSRGAYAARCLAGMLTKVGLMSSNMPEQLQIAYKLYKNEGRKNDEQARVFKHSLSRHVVIDFVGCWDSVSFIGAFYSRTLPYSSSSPITRKFRQALSCDECRVRRGLMMWSRPDDLDVGVGADERVDPDVLEVFFAGDHDDIGGSSTISTTYYKLSNLPLRWMVSEIILADVGILFRPEELQKVFYPLVVAGSVSNPFTSPSDPLDSEAKVEEYHRVPDDELTQLMSSHAPPSLPTDMKERDALDVLAPMHDNFTTHLGSRMLEFVPVFEKYQDLEGRWRRRIRVNFFKPRFTEGDVIFHESIKVREEDGMMGYKPKLRYKGVRSWVATPKVFE